MKTRFSIWALSGIHRGSIMQSPTRVLAEMPTLTSRAAITGTIQRRLAGTLQQVLAHRTSEALTRPYPLLCNKLRRCHTHQRKGDNKMSQPTCEPLIETIQK